MNTEYTKLIEIYLELILKLGMVVHTYYSKSQQAKERSWQV